MVIELQTVIEELYARDTKEFGEEYLRAFNEFKAALNQGRVRAAEPDSNSASGWRVNSWVKQGILLGFRMGRVVTMPPSDFQFRDKHTYPLKDLPGGQNI